MNQRQKGKSYDFQFTETAEKAIEIQNNQTQEEQMKENESSTSSKESKQTTRAATIILQKRPRLLM